MSKPRVPANLRRSVWAMLRDGVDVDLVAFHTGANINAIKRMQHFLRSERGQQYVQGSKNV